jgi:hypothetical protein
MGLSFPALKLRPFQYQLKKRDQEFAATIEVP